MLSEVTPWIFNDGIRTETYIGGSRGETYMIYLIFDCVAANREMRVNEESQTFVWIKPGDLDAYGLNTTTHKTLALKGLL